MPRVVCYLDGKYFEFTTVAEGPCTDLMSEEEFTEHYTRLYGEMAATSDHFDGLRARMARAREYGHSQRIGGDPKTLEEFLQSNMGEYRKYNEATDDFDDHWPGMEEFKRQWFSDSDEPVVGLQEHVNPVDE
jgi:hypothetical protein